MKRPRMSPISRSVWWCGWSAEVLDTRILRENTHPGIWRVTSIKWGGREVVLPPPSPQRGIPWVRPFWAANGAAMHLETRDKGRHWHSLPGVGRPRLPKLPPCGGSDSDRLPWGLPGFAAGDLSPTHQSSVRRCLPPRRRWPPQLWDVRRRPPASGAGDAVRCVQGCMGHTGEGKPTRGGGPPPGTKSRAGKVFRSVDGQRAKWLAKTEKT